MKHLLVSLTIISSAYAMDCSEGIGCPQKTTKRLDQLKDTIDVYFEQMIKDGRHKDLVYNDACRPKGEALVKLPGKLDKDLNTEGIFNTTFCTILKHHGESNLVPYINDTLHLIKEETGFCYKLSDLAIMGRLKCNYYNTRTLTSSSLNMLAYIVREQNISGLTELINHYNINVNFQDEKGRTALDLVNAQKKMSLAKIQELEALGDARIKIVLGSPHDPLPLYQSEYEKWIIIEKRLLARGAKTKDQLK